MSIDLIRRFLFRQVIAHRDREAIICLTLAALTIAVYGQTTSFDFVNYDDGDYVFANANIQRGFGFQSLAWAMTTGNVSSNWHPLTLFSHMLDWRLFGSWAGGHHLISLVFHIANTLLLFFVLRKMTHVVWESAFVAAVFALHPLHVQSVAWISERKDVLSAFFWMLTLWAYAGYAQGPGWRTYTWVLVFFIFGLLSKPMVVTLPFVLLLLDFWPLQRLRPNASPKTVVALIREKIPLFLLSAASAILTIHVQQKGGAVKSLDVAPLADRISNALISYINYIHKTLYPVNLAAFYPYPDTFPWWKVAAASVILAGITYFSVRIRNRAPYILVGWLWFLGALVPVIGLVQVGVQSMADRYMYLPMIGLSLSAAWGFSTFFANKRYNPSWLSIPTLFAIGVLSAISWVQAGYWRDSLALWNHAIDVTKNNYLAHYNLGGAIDKIGKTEQAIDHYQQSLAINPLQPEVYMSLGNALIKQKKDHEAQLNFQKAVRLAPENDQAQYNLGTFLLKQGNWQDALPYLEKSVRLKPDSEQAQFNLAKALFQKKDLASALTHAQQAIQLNPEHEKARLLAGAICFEQGDIKGAKAHFEAVLAINPKSSEALHYTGAIFLKQNQIGQALASFKKALALDPKNEESRKMAAQLTAKLAGLEERLIREIAKNPENDLLRKQLGKTYQLLGKHEKAREAFDVLFRKNPADITILYDLATLHADMGQFDTAAGFMRRAVTLQPDHPGHAYNMACLSARGNNRDEALRWLAQALSKGYANHDRLKKDPDLEPIRHTREFQRLTRDAK